jgi:DNA-directed RNA polymerase specialized sigma24 family protein
MGAPLRRHLATEQDRQISEVVVEQRSRRATYSPACARSLHPGHRQEVFTNWWKPIACGTDCEHVTGWLFASHAITSRPFPQKAGNLRGAAVEMKRVLQLEDLLPSPDAGPEALYFRNVLLDELEFALGELPREQREAFVAHELEGRSFKELSAESGVSVNTLLSRKRYAVLHLRERLQSIHDEFMKK